MKIPDARIQFSIGTAIADKVLSQLKMVKDENPKETEEFFNSITSIEELFKITTRPYHENQILKISILPSEKFNEFLGKYIQPYMK